MSREKQINEIAELLCQNSVCVLDEWDMCHIPKGEYCTKCESIAKVFYNAGYRKQSEGEWIKPQFLSRSGFYNTKEFTCNICNETLQVVYRKAPLNFCPNCGARMKGGN